MRCRFLLLLFLALASAAPAQLAPEPATVRISVLSLFHPQVLTLAARQPLALRVDGASRILDANRPATLRLKGTGLELDGAPLHTFSAAAATFTLTIPGKITRTYRGALTVTLRDRTLVPVVTMETETAVASIVAAESPPNASPAALEAQAIVTRSFLLANPHAHPDADSCDTTHCQFLRSPPPAESPAARATVATRNVVLAWRPDPSSSPRLVAARYSRSCGGHTRVPPASGPGEYPFYSVRCDFCLRHPEAWTRPAASTPDTSTEQSRLSWNRSHGWQAIPSNIHSVHSGVLIGKGSGHGIGLCQLGAADLAAHGKSHEDILRLYFPDTALVRLP